MNVDTISNPFRYLTDDFVLGSIGVSKLDPKVEEMKSRAAEGSVAIFNPYEDRSIIISPKYPQIKFSQVFSPEKWGAGLTKGLAGIIGNLVECTKLRDSVKELTPKQEEFVNKVYLIAEQVFKRLETGDTKMQDVRDLSRELDNFGGAYQTTELKVSELNKLEDLKIPSTYKLEVDKRSGHLIGVASVNVVEKMWNVKPVVEFMQNSLNSEGKLKFFRPYSDSFVVVAYKHEFKDAELINKIIEQEQTIEAFPEIIYQVPVRGDYCYEMIAAVRLSSESVNKIRTLLGLKSLAPELPPRFTFGAVPTKPMEIGSVIEYMNVAGLEKFRGVITSQIEEHVKRNQIASE